MKKIYSKKKTFNMIEYNITIFFNLLLNMII